MSQRKGGFLGVPQEGGRVQGWESVFCGGTIMFLGNLKDLIVPNTKIPPSTINYLKRFNIFSKHVWFNRIYLCFMAFRDFEDFSRFRHRKFPFFLSSEPSFALNPSGKQFSNFETTFFEVLRSHTFQQKWKWWMSQMLRYVTWTWYCLNELGFSSFWISLHTKYWIQWKMEVPKISKILGYVPKP